MREGGGNERTQSVVGGQHRPLFVLQDWLGRVCRHFCASVLSACLFVPLPASTGQRSGSQPSAAGQLCVSVICT